MRTVIKNLTTKTSFYWGDGGHDAARNLTDMLFTVSFFVRQRYRSFPTGGNAQLAVSFFLGQRDRSFLPI